MTKTPGDRDVVRRKMRELAPPPSEWAALVLRSRQSPSLAPRAAESVRPLGAPDQSVTAAKDIKAVKVRSPRRAHKAARRLQNP